jgi:3-hydroxyacyl-CoA dehydrogenase
LPRCSRTGSTSRCPTFRKWLEEKVEKGELGKKTGQGLYDYDSDGKPKKANHIASPDTEMIDRLVLPMINTCMACLREGVVADEDTLDAAMIFGTGFAPFRGGPMRYAAERGHDDIAQNRCRGWPRSTASALRPTRAGRRGRQKGGVRPVMPELHATGRRVARRIVGAA